MGRIGFWEILLLLLALLLLFGAKKLPELARSIGKSLNEFKKAKDEAFDDTPKVASGDVAKPPDVGKQDPEKKS